MFFSPYICCILLSFFVSDLFVYYYLKSVGVSIRIICLHLFMNIVFIIFGAFKYTYLNTKQVGLSSIGGVIGLLISVFIFTKIYKKHTSIIYHVNILSLGLLYSLSKIGCFFGGCCNCILNVSMPLVESIIFLILFLWLYYKKKNTCICIYSYAFVKFFLDFFRIIHPQVLSINQIVCICIIIFTFLHQQRTCHQ